MWCMRLSCLLYTSKSIGNGAKKLLERVMKALGVEGILTDDELARYKRIYLDNGTDHVELYPGVRSMLFELQRRGCLLYTSW